MRKKQVVKKRVISKEERKLEKVLTACGKCITHWQVDILENDERPDSENCALCILNGCNKCIIAEFTGKNCNDTAFDIHHDLIRYNGMITDHEIRDMIDVAVRSEISFLKVLKALTAERLKNERLKRKIELLQG